MGQRTCFNKESAIADSALENLSFPLPDRSLVVPMESHYVAARTGESEWEVQPGRTGRTGYMRSNESLLP